MKNIYYITLSFQNQYCKNSNKNIFTDNRIFLRFYQLILVMMFIPVISFGQVNQEQGENFELSQPYSSSSSYLFEATNSIELQPNFEYTPANQHFFNTTINPFLIFPPTEGENGGPNPEDNGVVGSIPGTFDVKETGAASYVIPIDIPEGRVSMTPDISLVYNSQSLQNGIIPKGWQIGGLSAINRTPYTQYINEDTHTISLSDEDQLMIDGVYLIKQENGEYKTEQVSGTKIIPYANDINKGFIVKKKDGLIYEYGRNENSRLLLQNNNTAITWYVNRITDRQGNYIDFNYYNDVSNGFITIKSIKYTGNSKSNKLPFYEIQFSYINDLHSAKKYFPFASGNFSRNMKILNNISIIYLPDNTLLKEYSLKYEKIYGELYLAEILLKSGDGSKKYNPTRFDFKSTIPKLLPHENIVHKDTLYDWVKIHSFNANINSDGYQDLIFIKNNKESYRYDIEIHVNSSMIYKHPSDSSPPFIRRTFSTDIGFTDNILDIKVEDMNGDGKSDIIFLYKKNQNIKGKIFYTKFTYLDNSKGREEELLFDLELEGPDLFFENITLPLYDKSSFICADFNSDGLNDLYLNYHVNPVICKGMFILSELNHPFSKFIFSDVQYQKAVNQPLVGDFDGDLKPEIIFVGQNKNTMIHCITNTNNPYIKHTNPNINLYNRGKIFTGDFNSDGRTDLIVSDKNGPTINLYHSYGGEEAEFLKAATQHFSSSLFKMLLIDINEDGYTDLRKIHVGSCSNSQQEGEKTYIFEDYIMQKSGDKFVKQQEYILNCKFTNINELLCGDYSGNGYKGFIYPLYDYVKILVEDIDDEDDNSEIPMKRLKNSQIVNNVGLKPELSEIKNGLGKRIDIHYAKFSDDVGFNKLANNITFPVIDFPFFSKVVDTCTDYNLKGSKGENSIPVKQIFKYRTPLFHVGGRGFLGFKEFVTINQDNEVKTIEYNSYDTQYYFMKKDSVITSRISKGYPFEIVNYLSKSYNSYKVEPIRNQKKRFFVMVDKVTNKNYNWNGDFLGTQENRTFVSNLEYGIVDSTLLLRDHKDLPVGSPINQYDYYSKERFSYYAPNVTNWVFGIPKEVTLEKHIPGEASNFIRKKRLVYDMSPSSNSYTLLRKEIKEYEDSKFNVEEEYKYDAYGNKIKITLSTPNEPSLAKREEFFEFSEDFHSHLLTKKWKKLGDKIFSTEYDYYPSTGKIKTEKDINGLVTKYEYDAFGTLNKKIFPDGNTQVIVKRWTSSGNIDEDFAINSVYYTWEKITGKKPIKKYYDIIGQELREVTIGFNGEKRYIDSEYDKFGYLSKKSNPYFKGQNPIFTTFKYDGLGKITTADDTHQKTVYTYGSNYVEINNGLGLVQKKETNAIGKVVKITDKSGSISYVYNASGQIKEVLLPNNQKVTCKYDINGNLIYKKDPDLGVYRYLYNPMSEMVSMTYPNENKDSLIYDNFGRVIQKITPDYVRTLIYDKKEYGLGKISKIIQSNKMEKHYMYDQWGRVISEKEKIKGEEFETVYEYDRYGRLKYKTFPSGLKTKYTYNDFGYQKKVSLPEYDLDIYNLLSVNEYGQATSYETETGLRTTLDYDAYGKPKKITTPGIFEEGYTYNHIKDVIVQRHRYNNGTIADREYFYFDNNIRLIKVKLNNQVLTDNISYYNNDNIKHKNNVGLYKYGENGSPPHALTSTVGQASNATPIHKQNITYTSFNKILTVNENNHLIKFEYGINDNRKKITYLKSNDESYNYSKKYIDTGVEFIEDNQTSKYLHYIGNAIVVMNTDREDIEVYQTYKDYLGSVVAITKQDQIVSKASFDAWGRRRNPEDWSYNNVNEELMFDIGYTGHEHLKHVGLINMNGRVYDPLIARFLSPDPYTQFPESARGYNRYSYVLNNPLKYTDPSGYSLEDVALGVINFLTFPARLFTGGVNYINDKINGNPEPTSGYFSSDYLLYGKVKISPSEMNNLIAGMKIFGRISPEKNFARYQALRRIAIINELMEYYNQGKFTITVSYKSESAPDSKIAKAFSNNDPLAIIYETINRGSYGMSFQGGGPKGKEKKKKKDKAKGDDPYQNSHGESVYTMEQFLKANAGLTRYEIVNQRENRSQTGINSQLGGPYMRYVVNPHDGRVLDMRHMLVVGNYPVAVGNLLEGFQWITGQASGMDPQDFYSNEVGYQFYMQYNSILDFFAPTTFTKQLGNFFNNPRIIYCK